MTLQKCDTCFPKILLLFTVGYKNFDVTSKQGNFQSRSTIQIGEIWYAKTKITSSVKLFEFLQVFGLEKIMSRRHFESRREAIFAQNDLITLAYLEIILCMHSKSGLNSIMGPVLEQNGYFLCRGLHEKHLICGSACFNK